MDDLGSANSFNDLRPWLVDAGPLVEPWCVLAGAGISLGSEVPNASKFLSLLFSRIAKPEDADCLRELAAIDGNGCHDKNLAAKNVVAGKHLRFEQVMACVGRFVPPAKYSDLLRCFEGCGPSKSHELLANLVDSSPRCTVFTTNFDLLIEQSRTVSGNDRQLSFVSESDHDTYEMGLFKLHGTLACAWERQNRLELTEPEPDELPAASMDLIGKVRHSRFRRARLIKCVNAARLVIVVGYSASDTFDIVPWLKRSRPKAMLWIEHANEQNRFKVRDADVISRMPEAEQSLSQNAIYKIASDLSSESRRDLIHVLGDTNSFWTVLESLLPPASSLNLVVTSPYRNWEDKLEKWCADISNDLANLIIAAAFLDAGRNKNALDVIKTFENTTTSGSVELKPSATEEGQRHLADVYPRVLLSNRKALEDKKLNRTAVFEQCCRKLQVAVDPGPKISGFRVEAQWLQESRKGEEALKKIEDALKIANNDQPKAGLLFIKTRILRDEARHRDALYCADETFKAAESEGDIYLEASARHEQAKMIDRIAESTGDVRSAICRMKEAIELRRALSQVKELTASLNVYATLHQHLVDFLRLESATIPEIKKAQHTALRYMKKARDLAKAGDDDFSLGEIGLNLCWYILKSSKESSAISRVEECLAKKLNQFQGLPGSKEHDKYRVAFAYAKLRKGERSDARKAFDRVVDIANKSEGVLRDKIVIASAKGGIALCRMDVNDMRNAANEFACVDYYRGQALCERLLAHGKLDSFCPCEIPDGLL